MNEEYPPKGPVDFMPDPEDRFDEPKDIEGALNELSAEEKARIAEKYGNEVDPDSARILEEMEKLNSAK